MKKFYPFIITALFLYLITAACKKDDTVTGGKPTATLAKIDSVIDYHYDYIDNIDIYHYDSEGRAIMVSYKDGSFDSLIYSDAVVLRKSFWPDGSLEAIDTYMLDSKGLATMVLFDSGKKDRSSAAYLPEGMLSNSKTSTSTQLFREYDADKYLVKETYYNSFYTGDTVTYLYTIKDGNVTDVTGFSAYPDYPYSLTETISYYTDKPNTLGNQNSGIAFLGKQNNNLYKTIIYDQEGYYSPDTVRYWYTFDFMNRVKMRYKSSTYSSYIDSTRYTYKN